MCLKWDSETNPSEPPDSWETRLRERYPEDYEGRGIGDEETSWNLSQPSDLIEVNPTVFDAVFLFVPQS